MKNKKCENHNAYKLQGSVAIRWNGVKKQTNKKKQQETQLSEKEFLTLQTWVSGLAQSRNVL